MMIVTKDCNLHLMSVVVSGDPFREPKGKLTCLDEQVKIYQVFHCEGLLLCILKEDDTKVVVWNPYRGQTRWIKTRFSHQIFTGRYNYAIGYVNKNKSCRSHKILRFFDGYVCSTRLFQFLWYETYDFESDLWTTLDISTPHWDFCFGQNGISLKGNTYWCASKRYSKEFDDHIICFDFTSERFGPLLSMPFSAGVNKDVTLSCVREEKLAILLMHNDMDHQFDIWITTKIEAGKISWSKFSTMNMRPDYPISRENFFIDEEKKVFMCFYNSWKDQPTLSIIGEGGYFRKLDTGEPTEENSWSKYGYGCSYVPSLVKIKQPTRGKRKQQSDLEERLYGEKMSILE